MSGAASLADRVKEEVRSRRGAVGRTSSLPPRALSVRALFERQGYRIPYSPILPAMNHEERKWLDGHNARRKTFH